MLLWRSGIRDFNQGVVSMLSSYAACVLLFASDMVRVYSHFRVLAKIGECRMDYVSLEMATVGLHFAGQVRCTLL